MPSKQEKKEAFFGRLVQYLEEYTKIVVVFADNVTSQQMHCVRRDLRNKATVLMGKNTMMRKVLRGLIPSNPDLEKLLPHVVGNIGFIFTNGDLAEIRDVVKANKAGSVAKAGAISPCDVIVPAGPTGLDPAQTSFFGALNIRTKIFRGQIEIISDVDLIKAGDKVGTSEAALLSKLGIKPFEYALQIRALYDNGAVYDPKILDITDDTICGFLAQGASNIAAISLNIGYPTVASVPHSVVRGFKNLLAIGLSIEEYKNETLDKIRDAIANPGAAAAAAGGAAAAEEAAPAEEEEDESSSGGGMGMFGGDSDSS